MAKLGFSYTVEEENTEKQGGGGGGVMPHMYAKIEAEAIEILPTPDEAGHRLNITFTVVEPEQFSGRKFWADWTISHPDAYNYGRYKYGKPMFDRFARATGVMVDENTDTDELLLRPFVAEIGIQVGNAVPGKPGEFYKDKNQIDRFFYDDDNAKEPIPELGIIGDGTQGKKRNEAPANDNRQAAAPAQRQASAPAAAAGGARPSRPWGQPK